MVVAYFLIEDKNEKSQFFKKTLLFANFSMNIALWMPFLTLSNIEIYFFDLDLSQRLYTIVEASLTIKQIELIKKKKFTVAGLAWKDAAFVVHIAFIG